MLVAENRTFICIVTYGRSGSTVLQTILQSIPGYFIRGENMNVLLPLYEASLAAHTARYQHGKKHHAPNDPWYGADEIIPERFREGLIDLFVEQIIQPPKDARAIGFKEIRFHEADEEKFESFLNFIHESFTDCKFIFNTRPWEEVCKSGWWATMDPLRVKDIVTGADKLYADYLEEYPERGIHMRHEVTRSDLTAFKPLFDFLGEDFDLDKVTQIAGKQLGHTGV